MENHIQPSDVKPSIALVSVPEIEAAFNNAFGSYAVVTHFKNCFELNNAVSKGSIHPVVIVSKSEILATGGISLLDSVSKTGNFRGAFFIIATQVNSNILRIALDSGVADVFTLRQNVQNIISRVEFSLAHWKEIQKDIPVKQYKPYKLPFMKRLFDIVFSSLALLALSPFFLLIMLLLKLESKGPIFYYSLRVGTGYRIFKFYKFRSMYVNADQRLKDLQHLNQYNATGETQTSESVTNLMLCADCQGKGACQQPLFADKNSWCEKQYLQTQKNFAGSAFFKLKDDPRITKVGKILRNTSADELPQLINVLIGDMSIVGNRPLPLYEAEKLTTDKYAQRFIAPAGITGLWQVEKRGKGEMSEEERLMLDNTYAQNNSFINDLRLIFRTIPALFQKENV